MKISLLTLVSVLLLNSSYAQLNYSYYEGSWSAVPNFGTVTPAKAGKSNNVDIAVRNRDVNYSMLWTGSISITTAGTYTFETNSDDGSKFVLSNQSTNSTLTVDNDGLHSAQVRTASMFLAVGTYPVAIAFFQQSGGQTMEVYYSSNTGIARQRIPDAAFASGASGSGGGGSAGSGGGLNYAYYEGAFSTIPDYGTLKPVKSGTSANFDLAIRGRDNNYTVLWTGNITIPEDGNYTFETNSDDGSKFVLANKTNGQTLAVNNDGLHAIQLRQDKITLSAGTYAIAVAYLQSGGDQIMEAYWSNNKNIARTRIPDNAFTGGSTTPTPPTPPTDPTPTPPTPPTPTPPTPPTSPTDGTSGTGGLTGSVNYYFSTSTGDDNRSSAQAQNPATPWKTVAKANSIFGGMAAGQAILFKRGEIFDGGLNVTRGGVIVSSYGTGVKPVISGFTTLGGWTPVANGIWEAPCAGQSLVNMVTVNNNLQIMGRWPNITENKKGFLNYEAHSGQSVLFDYNIPFVADWRGADIVIRKNRWVIDRCLITGYSSNSFTYNSASPMPPSDGYGYFIENHPGTLDQFGEWYYNPNAKRLRMFFGSNSPTNFEVKASVVPILLAIRGVSNVTIDNIAFVGSNDNCVEVASGANFTDITNCQILFSGINGLTANFISNFVFENSIINNTNNNAMYLAPFCSGAIIRNNRITNTGLYAGMGASNNDALQGVVIQGSNNQILNNVVENTGYNAIKLLGDNIVIKNNYVNQFCLTTDDGGGIYAANEYTKYNRQIIGNIITNGIGANEGTSQPENLASSGIYMDDRTANVDILNNTIMNMSENGIFVHNSHEINIQGNNIYNATRAQIVMAGDVLEADHPVRNVQMYNNILVAKRPSQLTTWLVTNKNDLWAFGNFDNNSYCRPADDNQSIGTLLTDVWNPASLSLATWKLLYGKDVFSTKSPVSIPYSANPDDYIRMEYNYSSNPVSVPLDGNYVDAKYNRYSGSITIPAFSSAILFKITSGTVLQSTSAAPVALSSVTNADEAVARTVNDKLTVNVLPNPATERVQIAINAPSGTKKASMSIYSIDGVLVKSIPVSLNSQNVAVDISAWKGGTYIVALKYDDKSVTKQFVKL